jgi:hypothetical protein
MNAQEVCGFQAHLGNPLYMMVPDPSTLTDGGIKQVRAAIMALEANRLSAHEQYQAAKNQAKAWIEGKHTEGRRKGEPVHAPREWARMWAEWERDKGAPMLKFIDAITAKVEELEAALEKAVKARHIADVKRRAGMVKKYLAKVKALQNAAQVNPEVIEAVAALAEVLGGDSLEHVLTPALRANTTMLDLRAERGHLISQGYKLKELPEIKRPTGLLEAVETILGRGTENVRERSIDGLRWAREQANKRLDDAALGK